MNKDRMTLDEARDIFPVSDYVKITGRCPRLAYKDIKEPGFPVVTIGQKHYIVKSAFIQWLNSKMGQTA